MTKFFIIILTLFSVAVYSQDEDNISKLRNKISSSHGKEKVELLLKLSREYGYTSFSLSEKYARIAEKYALRLNLDTALINIYRILGASKQYQNQLDSAIYYFNKSIEYSKKIDDKFELAKSSSNLGAVYASDKQFDKAEEIYLMSLKILQSSNDTNSISQILNNLGMVYRLKHNFNKALEYYQKALEITDSNTVPYAVKLSNIAEVYYFQGKLDKAIKQYLKSLRIFEEKDSKYNIAFTYKRLADLYFEQENIEKSKLYCLQSIEIAKDIDAKDILLHDYDLIIKIERKNNNLKSALRYYDLFTKVNNEINDIKRDKLLNELKVKYNIELKDIEIAQKNKTISIKNKFLLILSISVFISIVLIIILLFQIKKIRKTYKDLAKQNMNAVTAEEELIELKQNIISSGIKPQNKEFDELIDKIIDLVENKKVYLDPELTIFKFADYLQTNKTYVSQKINSEFNKNFSNFINDYRVAEARRLMTMPEYYNLTLAAIAKKAGFNSTSVFNRSFKRVTGITPSFFLKSVKENR